MPAVQSKWDYVRTANYQDKAETVFKMLGYNVTVAVMGGQGLPGPCELENQILKYNILALRGITIDQFHHDLFVHLTLFVTIGYGTNLN